MQCLFQVYYSFHESEAIRVLKLENGSKTPSQQAIMEEIEGKWEELNELINEGNELAIAEMEIYIKKHKDSQQ